MNALATETAIRRALAVLERASDSWRNGSPADEGPLHWPVAIQCAKRELSAALEALERLQERAGQLEAIARINAETIGSMQRAAAVAAGVSERPWSIAS